jgi:hypothetical protein
VGLLRAQGEDLPDPIRIQGRTTAVGFAIGWNVLWHPLWQGLVLRFVRKALL